MDKTFGAKQALNISHMLGGGTIHILVTSVLQTDAYFTNDYPKTN